MAVEPKPAATVILLRQGPEGPEVWLMERSRQVGFMASAWVFPGGRVDSADDELPHIPPGDGGDFTRIPRAFWLAAARELEEEANVRLGGERYDLRQMRPWSHWITPEIEPRRYDTWFFVARLPEGQEAQIDGGEAVNGGWFRPQVAIDAYQRGELAVAPPTLRTLQELSAHPDIDAIMTAPRRMPPICPRFLQVSEHATYVLLPGDPEFPADEAVDPPFRYEFALGRWRAR